MYIKKWYQLEGLHFEKCSVHYYLRMSKKKSDYSHQT